VEPHQDRLAKQRPFSATEDPAKKKPIAASEFVEKSLFYRKRDPMVARHLACEGNRPPYARARDVSNSAESCEGRVRSNHKGDQGACPESPAPGPREAKKTTRASKTGRQKVSSRSRAGAELRKTNLRIAQLGKVYLCGVAEVKEKT